ncbi:MAG: SulP family inorganic anion transporter [Segetibacter sp.]
MIKSKLKNDISAGIVVFLIALPLCLGVALASGAPLLSGVISGIIGGIVVGLLSRSQTSISGPAAGLAAVVLSAINELGAFEIFLTAVVIAGVIQLILGMVKAGFVANYIPRNVVKGLLAAIGIILILKQIPHAMGFDRDFQEDFTFLQRDGENTFTELLTALNFILPGAVIITAISIFVLITWDKTPMKKVKLFPASLFVVILGVFLNFIFKKYMPALAIQTTHLVNIPPLDTNNLGSYLHFPSLANFGNYNIWIVAFTIAIIASLETLLNIEAVDKIDPHKRETPQNNELIAQGVGNIFAGFLGGIPITSVIVRSSVNIQSGNETKFSAILQGVLMLISVLAFSQTFNLIPLASLAAILLMTGYRLARITIFKEMYRKGWEQFVPFVVTILAIVFTDLLIGVVIGLLVSIFYLLRSNFRNPFVKEDNQLHIGEVVKLELPNQVSFFNKASIKETLWAVPANTKVIIDATYSDYIDTDVLEIIVDFKIVVAPERNIQLNILGLKDKYQLSDHIQFINVLDKDTQQKLTPAKVLELLKMGNERFVNGKWTDKYLHHQVNATAFGQNPMAVLIGCIDSRTSPELLFDAGIGDLLAVRIAGNIITPEIIGSIEISVKKLGAKLIVVKGHSSCGAVALAMANVMDENMHTVTSKIQDVAIKGGCYPKTENADESAIMEKVTKLNAKNSVKEILEQSVYLKSRIDKKEIGIVSAYHDISNGKVYFEELN